MDGSLAEITWFWRWLPVRRMAYGGAGCPRESSGSAARADVAPTPVFLFAGSWVWPTDGVGYWCRDRRWPGNPGQVHCGPAGLVEDWGL